MFDGQIVTFFNVSAKWGNTGLYWTVPQIFIFAFV